VESLKAEREQRRPSQPSLHPAGRNWYAGIDLFQSNPLKVDPDAQYYPILLFWPNITVSISLYVV